ncbi:zinc-binding dehydrogenase [Cryptosporangium aurantiacum]|uniref:NADPH2:quinone reductase n=1 Tax=Cryptosporangium aurantiacum TaxID=134849 RepID=A0A1M7Q5E3_9ACTN|nr:zinc-binding dehydrogenase [Cryptosporangium aurantiacum]SHN25584.1 NADPH2:quinone reductase [Cryptosporangium aurantiacum]
MKTRAAVLTGPDGPAGLVLQERDVPQIGRRDVRIAVEAAGVMFAEVQMALGRYPGQPRYPFVPGYDLVGTVTDAGAASGLRPGQRVAAMTRTGAWAEHVVLPAAGLVAVPDELDSADAVALVTNGVTAHQLVHRSAVVRPGETVLVLGASGGVGTLLTQLSVAAGARVLGAASPAKHDRVRTLGGEPIDYHGDDLPARIRALAPDGVDVVFDPIGGAGLGDSWALLRPGGRLVWYGSQSTLNNTGFRFAPALTALRKIAGWNLRSLIRRDGRRGSLYYIRTGTPAFRADLATVFAEAAAGRLDSAVSARYPLERAKEALVALAEGRITGKAVLLPAAGSGAGGALGAGAEDLQGV